MSPALSMPLSMQVSKPCGDKRTTGYGVCPCLCLSRSLLAFPGDTSKRGRGLIGLVCEKRPQNINAWTCIGVALSAQGKRQRVRAKVADGGNPIEHDQGKSFL